jgi:rare lipoprotein A
MSGPNQGYTRQTKCVPNVLRPVLMKFFGATFARCTISVRFWQMWAIAILLFLALLTGCGGEKNKAAKVKVPPPPTIEPEPEKSASNGRKPSAAIGGYEIPRGAKPIYVETGIASWYGPPYHNRKGANGEVFDTNKLTAAHRTLPLNSIARVTNVKTGDSVIVRITDRGPFIEGRMLDLSLAAAKAVGVWRPGLATVKLEVFQAPSPIEDGGRWCVQIGAFTDKSEALKLKEKLARRYRTAQVLEFTGPTGDWVRIRPANDDKKRAEEVERETKVSEGAVFLVRLD